MIKVHKKKYELSGVNCKKIFHAIKFRAFFLFQFEFSICDQNFKIRREYFLLLLYMKSTVKISSTARNSYHISFCSGLLLFLMENLFEIT